MEFFVSASFFICIFFIFASFLTSFFPIILWSNSDRHGQTRLLCFPFWQPNFNKLFDGGLQYKIILTFFTLNCHFYRLKVTQKSKYLPLIFKNKVHVWMYSWRKLTSFGYKMVPEHVLFIIFLLTYLTFSHFNPKGMYVVPTQIVYGIWSSYFLQLNFDEKILFGVFFHEWNEWNKPQFKSSSQNLIIECNFFKWDGNVIKI